MSVKRGICRIKAAKNNNVPFRGGYEVPLTATHCFAELPIFTTRAFLLKTTAKIRSSGIDQLDNKASTRLLVSRKLKLGSQGSVRSYTSNRADEHTLADCIDSANAVNAVSERVFIRCAEFRHNTVVEFRQASVT